VTVVVVAASSGSSEFAVIDFTSKVPSPVMVPANSGGNVVDCYGTLAAVGDCASGTVAIYDISTPATPTQVSSIGTVLSAIGSISIDGTNVLAGENGGTRLALLDISVPASPSLKSVYGAGSEGAWLGTISGVAIRGTNAVVAGTDGFGVIDYTKPGSPTAVAYPSTFSTVNFDGQVIADFDGWNAVATAGGPNNYVYAVSDGIATEPPTAVSQSTPSSIAIAEIPDGGYYVAVGIAGGLFSINGFPSGAPNAFFLSAPLESSMSSIAVAVKFLNNPAEAPFLAVANVTSEGFFVRSNFLVLESNESTSTIQIATPHPVATVALAATNPTLGITAFTLPTIHIPPGGWQLPPWILKIWQWLGG
jgi:hypothetical protein